MGLQARVRNDILWKTYVGSLEWKAKRKKLSKKHKVDSAVLDQKLKSLMHNVGKTDARSKSAMWKQLFQESYLELIAQPTTIVAPACAQEGRKRLSLTSGGTDVAIYHAS